MEVGLLDTSVVVAVFQENLEQEIPAYSYISSITLAELHTGVLIADSDEKRIARLETLVQTEQNLSPLPVDEQVARRYGELVAQARTANHKPKPFDTLIAATALAHDLPLLTRDKDFSNFASVTVINI